MRYQICGFVKYLTKDKLWDVFKNNRQLVEGGQYLVEVEVEVEAQANKNFNTKQNQKQPPQKTCVW